MVVCCRRCCCSCRRRRRRRGHVLYVSETSFPLFVRHRGYIRQSCIFNIEYTPNRKNNYVFICILLKIEVIIHYTFTIRTLSYYYKDLRPLYTYNNIIVPNLLVCHQPQYSLNHQIIDEDTLSHMSMMEDEISFAPLVLLMHLPHLGKV